MHVCDERCDLLMTREAHQRSRARMRAAKLASLHGKRPRLRARKLAGAC